MTLPPPPSSGAPLLPPPPEATGTPSPYETGPGPAPMSANGVAIAALICGLAFIVPLAPVVAVVLGVIALRQLRRRARAGRPQRGRGMAITGIVLGSLGLLIWALVVVAAVRFADENDRRVPSQSGARATSGRVTVDQLRPGDCFSGISPASLDWASLNRCDDAHEMQLITTVDLADEPYPGDEDAAGDLVEQRCVAASEPLLDESTLDRVDLFFIYQNTRLGWRQNSTALCIAASADGVLLGSVLQ